MGNLTVCDGTTAHSYGGLTMVWPWWFSPSPFSLSGGCVQRASDTNSVPPPVVPIRGHWGRTLECPRWERPATVDSIQKKAASSYAQGCKLGNKEVKLLISPPLWLSHTHERMEYSCKRGSFFPISKRPSTPVPTKTPPNHNSNVLYTLCTIAFF